MMSITTIQNELNTVDMDIANANRKKAEADSKVNECESKILRTRKSITKNTSSGTLASKMRQIEGYERHRSKASKNSADWADKLVKLQKKRLEIAKKLQKAEDNEREAQRKTVQKMQSAYEQRIRDLTTVPVSLPPEALSIQNSSSGEVSTEMEIYDVFVSHAWEDKDDFVDELVREMILPGIKVWYDTKRMSRGDSMRQKIDEGLRRSKFGIVVLSPNYIADG